MASDGLTIKAYQLDARGGAGMSDREDLSQSRWGQFRLMLNQDLHRDTWDRRDGWKKVNKTRMPWERGLFIDCYVDTQKVRHVLVVGDDGNLYHDLDWSTPVVIRGACVWDGTYTVNGCAFGDDYYLCFSGADGSARTLRYDGISGVAWAVGLPGPAVAVTPEDAGAGNIPGNGNVGYRVSFYWVEEGWESEPSPIATLGLGANRKVLIPDLPIFAGWTGPARTIHRRIYRYDAGGAWYLLATIPDNTTASYLDNLAETTFQPFVYYRPLDAFHCCALNRNGIMVWAYEPTENTPALIYTAVDAAHPESLRLDNNNEPIVVHAGGDDDPIVGLDGMRDGVFVYKNHSLYLYSRLCEDCEGIHEGLGCVSWRSIANVGAVPWWLTQAGPVGLDPSVAEQYRFAGPDPQAFALRELWEGVVKSALRFSWGLHVNCQGRKGLLWSVRRCATGTHNDTIIVWEYANRTAEFPFGKFQIWSMLCDGACRVRVNGGDEDEIWGLFPNGFVGKLFQGQCGDGTDELLFVTPTWVSGNLIGLDPAALPSWALAGSGLVGTSVFVNAGTGMFNNAADVPVCYPDQALITFQGTTSAHGFHIQTKAALGLDTTSQLYVGGFRWALRWRHDAEAPGIQKQWAMLQVNTKGTL